MTRPPVRVTQGAEEDRLKVLAVLSAEHVPMPQVRQRLLKRRLQVGALSYRLGELVTLGHASAEGQRGSYTYAVTPAGETYLNEEYR